MFINRKNIFIVLFCCVLAFVLSGTAVAAKKDEAPETPAVVELTDTDKEIMDFISNTKANEWDKAVFDERPEIVYDKLLQGYTIYEQNVYFIKEKIAEGPIQETKVLKRKVIVDIADFLLSVYEKKSPTKVQRVFYWKHKETGIIVATEVRL